MNKQQLQSLIVIGTISSLDEISLSETEEKIDKFLKDFLEKRTNIVEGRDEGIYLASIGNHLYDSVNNITRIDLEFNPHPKNWPYDWLSHRFRKSTNHVFIVNIFALIDSTTMTFQRLERYHGPAFRLD